MQGGNQFLFLLLSFFSEMSHPHLSSKKQQALSVIGQVDCPLSPPSSAKVCPKDHVIESCLGLRVKAAGPFLYRAPPSRDLWSDGPSFSTTVVVTGVGLDVKSREEFAEVHCPGYYTLRRCQKASWKP